MPSSPRKVAIDTGPFIALLSSKDAAHKACLAALQQLSQTTGFFTTEACLVEVSYLLPARPELRQRWQQLMQLLDIAIAPLDRRGLTRIYELMDKYDDLPMDFADATIVVACENLDIRHVFTLDVRDFSIYRPSHCQRFKLLPKD